MERRKNKNESLEACREVRLATEDVLRQSLEEKNARIRALEEEIRALRSVVSPLHLDTRFWLGFPIGLFDDSCGCPNSKDLPEDRRN